MDAAGRIYAQNPDPDTKLGDLKTMELGKLKIVQNRYKKIIGNRVLLCRLKDQGESARRALAAVEDELAVRAAADSGPPPLESRQVAAEVDRLAQRMARMEWNSGHRPGERAALDSDDDPDPEELMQTNHVRVSPTPPDNASSRSTGGDGAAAATTRQLLPKSATSRREARFLTNRPRPGGGAVPAPPGPAPARRNLLAQWSDSALAAPDRPDVQTRLLDMDESLQLLTQHSQQTQAERAAQLAARYAAAGAEDGMMDLEAASDTDEMDDMDPEPATGAGDET